MKTKEKLELLWKYLLLLVLAVGVFRFTSNDYNDHDEIGRASCRERV